MYSQKGDVVLDPFMGLGTTAIVSILCKRNSVGFEIDHLLKPLLKDILSSVDILKANALIHDRYKKHLEFVDDRIKQKKEVKYGNAPLGCKVMTGQETDLTFHYIDNVKIVDEDDKLKFESTYLIDCSLADVPIGEKGSLFE